MASLGCGSSVARQNVSNVFMWHTAKSASGILETLKVMPFHLCVDTETEGQRG